MRQVISYLGQTPVKNTKNAETFTLTSGYNENNSAFVRCKDGAIIGAIPTFVREGDSLVQRHICCEGYLYCTHPGYVFATFKEGGRGWSEPWQIAEDHYRIARALRENDEWSTELIDIFVRVDEDINEVSLHIQRVVPNPASKEVVLGCYIHDAEPVTVTARPFTGLKSLLEKLFHPQKAVEQLREAGETGFKKLFEGFFWKPDDTPCVIDTYGKFFFAEKTYEEYVLEGIHDYCPSFDPSTLEMGEGIFKIYNSSSMQEKCIFVNVGISYYNGLISFDTTIVGDAKEIKLYRQEVRYRYYEEEDDQLQAAQDAVVHGIVPMPDFDAELLKTEHMSMGIALNEHNKIKNILFHEEYVLEQTVPVLKEALEKHGLSDIDYSSRLYVDEWEILENYNCVFMKMGVDGENRIYAQELGQWAIVRKDTAYRLVCKPALWDALQQVVA